MCTALRIPLGYTLRAPGSHERGRNHFVSLTPAAAPIQSAGVGRPQDRPESVLGFSQLSPSHIIWGP